MSLLLDALKRAEQEKSARQSVGAPAEAPRAPAAQAKTVLELQPVAHAREAAQKSEARDAAAAIMHAKIAPDKPGVSKASIAWTIVAVAIVLVGAGAGYVWYAMQPLRAAAPVSERKRAPALPPVAAVAPAAAPVQPSIEPPAAAASRAAIPGRAAPAPDTRVAEAPQAASAGPAPAPREPDDAQRLMANLLREAATPVAPPVKFSRAERAAISPEVRSGYAALVAGDLATARRTYLAALTQEPNNVDALLGVATVDARLGNRDAARAYYRKVLETDPRNPTALAGLGATAPAVAPDALEAQLRGALARDPESAALHFTLGGLYAAQSRWGEAQARFFDAHRLDPANADAAYNLAVSLEHIGQPRLAAQYYSRALAAAEAGAAQFDRAAARRRLAELGR